MLPALKAEFRKLVTVRSTYIITGLTFALVIFYTFYVIGWRATVHNGILDPLFLETQIFSALGAVMSFGALIAVLIMSHEYRYGTIMYTLTAANSRTKVLIAKLLVIFSYAAFFAIVIALLAPTMTALGMRVHHVMAVHQTFAYGKIVWECLFYSLGYSAAGFVFALLFRNVVAAIAVLFLYPGAVEQLLGQLLGHNKSYLPFTALDGVIGGIDTGVKTLTPGHAALVYLAYLVGGLVISWAIFMRRDAN